MNSYKTSKTILSIFLSLILIASTATIAFAAEALAVKNVSQWPTISYRTEDGTLVSNGYMYYGQKVSDALVINDDEIVLNAAGEQVAGHFEFIDPDEIPDDINDAMRSNIKFVPDDTDMYTGFQRKRSRDTTFKVISTTPVLVNDAPTATSVDSGSSLSASVISGGQVMNPYYPEETSALNAKWSWSNPDTVIYESGEYEAKLYIHTAYVEITKMIYVEVNSAVKATTIAELPTAEIEFAQELTYNDLVLNGGKAVEYGTETEVSGSFSVKNPNAKITGIGTYNVPVVFTPDDTENYIASEGTATVTVTKANYKFVNENGEEIVPELTLPYGTTFDQHEILGNSLKVLIKDRAQLSGVDAIGSLIFEAGDKDTVAPIGTNTYNVRVRPYNSGTSNYNVTDLQFILTIEPVTVEMKLSSSIDKEQTINISTVNSNDPYPQGTFDIYVDGALYMEDVKGSFPFDPGKSGKYDIRMVYNPAENDPCVVEEKTVTWTETYHRNLNRGNLVMGSTATVMYGKEVKLNANIPEENFGGWKITDAKGNEVVLEDAVMEGRDITFTMPDFDITVEAIDKSADTSGGGIDDIFGDLGDLTEGDSDNPFENIINNLVAFFKNIIEKIKGFFRGIGDLT